jgi:acyl CoA:acetate/3-ketoacid CoA transferase beta subunit
MAGAMGLGFMPTKSLLDSSIADDNKGSFLEMSDPFGGGERVGLVKALNPDFSIIHGLAADQAGNVIPSLSTTSGQGVWGALASKEGVLVTVEKVVTTDFIRNYSHLVQIPGYLVRSVSLAPKGAHPQGLFSLRVAGIDSYEADYEFMQEHSRASRKRETLDVWIEEWITGCLSHNDYLQKLGSAKLNTLVHTEEFSPSQMKVLAPCSVNQPHNTTEMMIVVAARKIIERLEAGKYFTVLTGAGVSMLASWLAYYQIRDKRPEIQLVTGSGLFGYTPYPGEVQRAGTVVNMATAKIITEALHMYGVFICGINNRCISILGTAQIDKQGNLNTSRLSGRVFLVGSGGANDAVNASEVMVVTHQSRERFVKKVDYVTCPGKNVRTLISDKGIFEKQGKDQEFVLTGYFASARSLGSEEVIAQIKSDCTWDLKVSKNVTKIAPPTLEELTLLRTLDPNCLFIGE